MKNKQTLKKLKTRYLKDTLYKSLWINKLTNRIMLNGQKEQAYSIVKKTFANLKWKLQRRGDLIFREFLMTAQLHVELLPKRVGKQIRYIPIPINPLRSKKKAIKWLVTAIKSNKSRGIVDQASQEILRGRYKTRGGFWQFREEIMKTAIENRRYTRYRWY